MARLKDFRGVEGTNFFEQDRGMELLLSELLPEERRGPVLESVREFAGLVAGPWNELAREASRNENLPRLIKHDRVGNPVERVDLGPLTRRLRREVAEFGLLRSTESELHKFALVYYTGHNGEASLTCGVSCTDGLIRSVEARGDEFLRDHYLPLLRSVDTPFAGAQFVTEQAGGSDVGALETGAAQNPDGTWAITGEKWFCSNPDEYFLVAARPHGRPSGTGGVAVFLVPRVLPDGTLNSLSYRRLKDKLGTRSLPTAEIDFKGATGYAIGDPSEGFKTLMNYVINASRIHNAVNSCGILHRAFLEARNYARQREAFGGTLVGYPLVRETLVSLLERLWRHRLLTFRMVALADLHTIAPPDPEQAMWQRFLMNLSKYRTSATLAESVREAILVLGANGVVEDFSILPRLLRDTLIIETWEGTHNTLCLQILRDAGRSNLVGRWRAEVGSALERWPRNFLSATRENFERSFERAGGLLSREALTNRGYVETHARRLVDMMGGLLEIAWMSDLAARHAEGDATAAVLTSLAGYHLLPKENDFTHPGLMAAGEHSVALIDEEPFVTDVSRL
ncbi:MAG TPA: acyl-CoA dehydrogenase family protein [Blastocatellia bacterium]|nr:acyl-CoA dehydrogenase family protein [Blastocatellia bacterium]